MKCCGEVGHAKSASRAVRLLPLTSSTIKTTKDVMSLLRAFGQCQKAHLPILLSACPRGQLIRPKLLAQWQSTPLLRTRLQTTATTLSKTIPKRSGYVYPTELNVFHTGSVPVVTLGLVRAVCWAMMGYGMFWAAPSLVLNPETTLTVKLLYAPVIFASAAVPLLLTGVLCGGYAHAINVVLPSTARRSKEDLMRFANNIPLKTPVQIKAMWFRPWPHTDEVAFEDLRRLPLSFTRMANVELVSHASHDLVQQHPLWNWLAKTMRGRYCVRRNPNAPDRSHVPGAWDRMWEQIPKLGHEAGRVRVLGDVVERRSAEQKDAVRKPVQMANRATSTLKKPPPPRGSKR